VSPPEEFLWRCLKLLMFSVEDPVVCVLNIVDAPDQHATVQSILAQLSCITKMQKTPVTFLPIVADGHGTSFGPSITVNLDEESAESSNVAMANPRVQSLLKKRPELNALKEDILNECSRLFHDWSLVDCFIRSLETLPQASPWSVHTEAMMFRQPEKAFLAILARVPETERKWVRDALMWLTHSLSPLTLSELGTVLVITTIDPTNYYGQDETLQEYGRRSLERLENYSRAMAFDLAHTIPGLVEVDTDEIHLTNPQLRSSLQDDAKPEQAPWYATQQSHYKIAKSCLSYLLMYRSAEQGSHKLFLPEIGLPWCGGESAASWKAHQEFFEKWNFLEYATKYWRLHLQKAETQSLLKDDFLTKLVGDGELMTAWTHLYHSLESAESEEKLSQKLDTPIDISTKYGISLSLAVELFDAAMVAKCTTELELDGDSLVAMQLTLHEGQSQPNIIPCEKKDSLKEPGSILLTGLRMGLVRFGYAFNLLLKLDEGFVLRNARELLSLDICRGGTEVLQYLLAHEGMNTVDFSPENTTPLHTACLYGYSAVVHCFRGDENTTIHPWVNLRDFRDYAPLHLAVEYGHLDIVEELIDIGAEVNSVGPLKLSPLSIASKLGFKQIVKYLLGKEGIIHSADESGRTALHYACMGGFIDVARALMASGATPSGSDKAGDNALHFALRNHQEHIIRLLLDGKQPETTGRSSEPATNTVQVVDLNQADSEGKKPLLAALENEMEEIAILFVKANANLEIRDGNNRTPLSLAILRGYVRLVEELLSHKADPNLSDNEGQTPLHLAANMGSGEMVRILLENGSDVDATNSDHDTALRLASEKGHAKVVDQLLTRKPVKSNLDALDAAMDQEHKDVVAVLLTYEPIVQPTALNDRLQSAAVQGSKDIVTLLLDAGADKNYRDVFGNTALQLATYFHKPEVVYLLLARGVALEGKDDGGYTALCDASRRGSTTSSKMLLDAGADMETETDDGKTPLHLTATSEELDCFRMLLKRGAQLKPTKSWSSYDTFLEYLVAMLDSDWMKAVFDEKQKTERVETLPGFAASFRLAVRFGKLDTVDLLLQYGADVNEVTGFYGTVLQRAARSCNIKMVTLLLEHPKNAANVNQRGGKYGTALQTSVSGDESGVSDKERIEMINLLRDKGASLSIAEGPYGTVLHIAMLNMSEAVVRHVLDITKLPPDLKDLDGRTPIHIAAYRDYWNLVSELRSRSEIPSLRMEDEQGRMPVHHAAAGGSISFLEGLVEREGKDILNSPDKDGWTPLHWACRQYSTSAAVRWLIDNGASAQAKTKDGWTPKHVAIYHDNPLAAELCDYGDLELSDGLPEEAEDVISASCDGCYTVRLFLPAK
jgi:ankyrin repeat protein